MSRRNELRFRPRKGGAFWYPVENANLYDRGDVVWLSTPPRPGRYRVRARGRGEILVEPLSAWNLFVRVWVGRLRRFWLRVTRR